MKIKLLDASDNFQLELDRADAGGDDVSEAGVPLSQLFEHPSCGCSSEDISYTLFSSINSSSDP